LKELERILKACLAGRPGAGTRYVERGEYGVVFNDGFKDGGFITPVNFTEKVEAGIQLEVSILERRVRDEIGTNQNICPHCRCPRPEEAGCGWYKWSVILISLEVAFF
jgi:hypothetical protein